MVKILLTDHIGFGYESHRVRDTDGKEKTIRIKKEKEKEKEKRKRKKRQARPHIDEKKNR